jgi:hypothetical protein
MTLPATTRRAGPFPGNGATTAFPFTFKVFAASDIAVTLMASDGTETELVLDSDYSVTLNADQETSPGGTINYPLAGDELAADELLTAVGDLDYEQPTDLPSGGNFRAGTVEDALDRQVMLIQQVRESDERSLKFPVSDGSPNAGDLPSAIARASKFLAFDAAGSPMASEGSGTPASAFMATVLDDADAAAARTTLGAVGSADLAASGGSALTGFLQAGAGAIARTAQDKLRDILSVKDFGAKGDATTNDTDAIQAAINQAAITKQAVYFPGGTYIVVAPLTISPIPGVSQKLIGDGHFATAINASGNFAAILSISGNTQVEGIGFVQTSTTTKIASIAFDTVGVRFTFCSFVGDMAGDLVYSNGQNVDFDRCSWKCNGANTYAVNFDSYNQNCGFTDNRVGGPGKGIRVTDAFSPSNRVEGLRITNSYFINTSDTNIEIGSSLLTTINGCVIDQCSIYGVWIKTGADNVVIDGNYIGSGAPATAQGVHIEPDAGQGHVISNNTIGFVGYGIHVAATGAARVNKVSITGNAFNSVANPLFLDSVIACSVTGNVDHGVPANGSWQTLSGFGAGSYVFDNNCWHTASPSLFHVGSAYRFGNDTGIVGRNRGAQIVNPAATSTTISHGLFRAPTKVLATPDGGVGVFNVQSVGATTFLAAWATNTTTIIYWDAEV